MMTLGSFFLLQLYILYYSSGGLFHAAPVLSSADATYQTVEGNKIQEKLIVNAIV